MSDWNPSSPEERERLGRLAYETWHSAGFAHRFTWAQTVPDLQCRWCNLADAVARDAVVQALREVLRRNASPTRVRSCWFFCGSVKSALRAGDHPTPETLCCDECDDRKELSPMDDVRAMLREAEDAEVDDVDLPDAE